MTWLLIWALTGLCVGMLVNGLLVPGRFYEYPFLAAGIFLTFILPQLPGIANNAFISESALTKTLIFSFLCLAMCGIGWKCAVGGKASVGPDFSEQRLLKAATAYSLVGAYFFYKFGHLPDDLRLRGQLTGLPVAYLFFAKLLTYGFALALICFARKTSKLALFIILFDSFFYFERIVIAGRRSEAAEFFLLIALAFWFQKRWVIPRIAVIAGLCMSTIGMLAAGEYRQATYYGETQDWGAVADIDLAKNWDRMMKDGGPEMTNAVLTIQFVEDYGTFNYGYEHWNGLIFTFVPAQLVGQTIKNALLIPSISMQRSFTAGIGETSTGMADAFTSFWYFGCLKFFLAAYWMGRLFAGAMIGNTVSQLYYMLLVAPSMLVISHFTNEIVIAFVHIFVFVAPAIYYARVRPRPEPTGSPVPST